MNARTLIFVGGLHRSGTTPLARALGDHPMISDFRGTGAPEEEGQHLQSVYPPARRFGGPGRFAFAPKAHLTEESELVSEQNRERLWSEWLPYWDVSKPFLLEKSPPNLIRMRFLQALFPGALFIIVMRHPVAVSYATLNKWGRKWTSLSRLIHHWIVAHETFRSDLQYVTNVEVVRYEDFIANPDAVLAQIYSRLGVDVLSAPDGIRSDGNLPYVKRWNEDRRRFPWRFTLPLVERRYEDGMSRFGYSFRDLDPEPHTAPPVAALHPSMRLQRGDDPGR